MTLKTYNQNCGLAAALDILGERWTLLIIRTLLAGPARFGEIQSALPGIGSNLLSERLKLLVRRGVIDKPATHFEGYALTKKGEGLGPIVKQLAAWGREFLPLPGAVNHPSWTMFNLEAAFRSERAQGVEAVVEFRMGEQVFHMLIRRQTCRAVPGPALAPDLSILAEQDAFEGTRGRVQIKGDPAVFDRVRPCFEL